MSKQPQKSVEVTLLKNHTHHGQSYKEGDTISVRPYQVTWLAQQGVIAAAAATTSTPEKEAK